MTLSGVEVYGIMDMPQILTSQDIVTYVIGCLIAGVSFQSELCSPWCLNYRDFGVNDVSLYRWLKETACIYRWETASKIRCYLVVVTMFGMGLPGTSSLGYFMAVCNCVKCGCQSRRQ